MQNFSYISVAIILGVFFLSLLLTFLTRYYAVKNLLDIPNHRSSHQIPTPRGGGLGIVLSFFLAIMCFFLLGWLKFELFVCTILGLIIAGIGFWDDHQSIAARWRFLMHLSAAIIAVSFLHGFPDVYLGLYKLEPGLVGYFIAVLYLVWNVNLFNFMDGIDGIAGSEAVFVSGALAVLMYFIEPEMILLSVALAGACLGFLVYNWPPAKIFMGDVGSGFVGFILGVLVLAYSHKQPVFLYIGLVLFAVFIIDASFTLCYRFLSGEKWFQAHRSHAYQNAARRYGHLKVVQGVWLINLLWLLPLAIAILNFPAHAWVGLLFAYMPLIYLAYILGAGIEKTYSIQ